MFTSCHSGSTNTSSWFVTSSQDVFNQQNIRSRTEPAYSCWSGLKRTTINSTASWCHNNNKINKIDSIKGNQTSSRSAIHQTDTFQHKQLKPRDEVYNLKINMIRFEHMIFQSVFDPTDQHDNTTFPVRNRQRKPAYTPDATVYMWGSIRWCVSKCSSTAETHNLSCSGIPFSNFLSVLVQHRQHVQIKNKCHCAMLD